MEKFTVTEGRANLSFLTYLYNALSDDAYRLGGKEELLFGEDRVAVRISGGGERLYLKTVEKIAEIVAIGYKYRFLRENLHASLGKNEMKLLLSALIAADLEGDCAYVRGKIRAANELALDGFYTFRLAPLREKWARIAQYVPLGFSSEDLRRFCEFMVGESQNKVYLQGKSVFGEDFLPFHRSKLLGEEDAQTEIMLSDAGFVYCLGEVDDELGDFLQKYYAERAIFS